MPLTAAQRQALLAIASSTARTAARPAPTGRTSSKGPSTPVRVGGNTEAGKVLRDRLDTIQRYAPDKAAGARQTAMGGVAGMGLRAALGLLTAIDVPRRVVTAGIEEGAEFVNPSLENEFSFSENVKNPNYGVGTILERQHPDMNIWAKRGLGLVGDIATDPLTYATFGAAPALTKAGGAKGLTRLAVNASDNLLELGEAGLAKEMKNLAAKIGEKGIRSLTDDEIKAIAVAAGREELLKKGGHFGASLAVPFTKLETGALPGTGRLGRAIAAVGLDEGALGRVTGGLGGKVSRALGGEEARAAARKAMRSGDPEVVAQAVRTLDALASGQAVEKEMGSILEEGWKKAGRDVQSTGMDWSDATKALRERPTATSEAGPAWLAATQGKPDVEAALGRVGQFLDETPGLAADKASHGKVRDAFIHDANEAGRPYVPRIMTDEVQAKIGKEAKFSSRAEQRAWFERKAKTVGDEVIPGEAGTVLVKPGEALADGTVAPALEEQIQRHVDAFFGEEGVKWYEDDLSKIMPKYIHGVAKRTGQVRTQNYLRAKGMMQRYVEYTLDPFTGERVGVTRLLKEVESTQDAIANKQVVNMAELAKGEAVVTEAWQKRLAGEVTQAEYDATVERVAANKALLTAEVRADEERLRKSVEQVLRTQADQAEKRVAADAAEAEVVKAQAAWDAAQAKVDELTAKVQALPALAPKRSGAFESLKRAVAARDAQQTEVERLRRLPARVAKREEEAVNAIKVAEHLRNALEDPTGAALLPNAPYMDTVAEHTGLDMSQLTAEDVQATASYFDKMAEERLGELKGIGEQYPADLSPDGVDQAVHDSYQAMQDAWFEGDEQAYDDHLEAYARAYSLQSLHSEGKPPSVADLTRRTEKMTADVNKKSTSIVGRVEGQGDVQAAQLANQADAYEARLNSHGATMYPEQVGAGEVTIQSFLGNEVAPGTFTGPDGITRRVMVDQTHQGQDLAAHRVVSTQVMELSGVGYTPTTYLGGRGVALEVPADAVPLSAFLVTATQEQKDTVARQYLDGGMIDLFFGHEMGVDDLMRTEGGRLLRYPTQVGVTSDRHIFDQMDRMFFGSVSGESSPIQQTLLKASSLSPSETTEHLISGYERLVTLGTYASNSGTGIDWRVLARRDLGDEVGDQVGARLNKRFAAIDAEMRSTFMVDTDEVIAQALDSDVRELGNFGTLFDPEYRTFQGSPGLKQADLQPPGGSETWTHTSTITRANPTGDVRLDQTAPLGEMLNRTSAEFFDWLFGPNTTSTSSLQKFWQERWAGASGAVVHQPQFRTVPERVRVYGAPGYDALAGEVRAEGRVSARGTERFSTKGQEVAGQQVGQQGGRGMDFLANDLWERTMRLRPDLVDDLLPNVADPRVRDLFEQAKRLQAQAEITEGVHITQADALEIAARHQAGILDPQSSLRESLRSLPRDRHRPMAAELQAQVLFGEVTDNAAAKPLRYEVAKTVRDSLAVDSDVLMMVTAPGEMEAFVHALPTSQIAMNVPTSPGGDAVSFVRQTDEAFKDATKQRAAVTRRRKIEAVRDAEIAQAVNQWPQLQAVEHQFSVASRDLDNATDAVHSAVAQYQAAVREKWGPEGVAKAARVKNLADYEATMTAQALSHAKAGEADLAKMAKIESTYAKMRRQAVELGVEADWNAAMYDHLAAKTGDFEFLLHQGWKGYGFGFQAPENVVDILQTTAKGWEPRTGSGLETFLKGYDRIHNWMKGWLTTSFGFHFRNTFGGTFNNWMAGVDIIKSTTAWGNLYRKAGVRGSRAEGLSAADRGVFEAIDRMGILRSGTFYEEFNIGLEGASLNPFAGTRSSGKAFVAPYASRKLGENVTEPVLRGTMAYDRLMKAMAKGRITVDGVKITNPSQITEEMIPKFVSAVNDASGVSEEILDDIAKYHFDYSDLSAFERNVGRRVVPFYTWTRRNIPLQVELLMTQPRGIQRYMAVKRNLELGTPEEGIVPSYFGEQMMIRTPWTTKGSRMYGTIDLPFKDPLKLVDPGQALGMVTPMLKTPVEVWAGKQFFSDVPLRDTLYEAPGTWSKIPGFMQALSVTGRAQKSPKDGKWYMREKDAYLVGQYIPFLNQARRLVPSEPKYQNRVSTQFASYLTGITMRANTPQDQEAEVFRRTRALDATVKDLKSMGVIPTKG